jgi:hypothetical protein
MYWAPSILPISYKFVKNMYGTTYFEAKGKINHTTEISLIKNSGEYVPSQALFSSSNSGEYVPSQGLSPESMSQSGIKSHLS